MSLEEQIANKEAEILEKKAKIEQLQFENAQLKKLIFGSKSERFKGQEIAAEQGNLFADPQEEPVVQTTEQITYTRKKNSNHNGRNVLPAHLPTREVIIEPQEDITRMVKIGELITETLDYTPASLIKVVTIRPKYAVKGQDEDDNNKKVVIASLPSRPIEKCIAEPGLLAHIIVRKFIDHMPFYRQIQRFKRDFYWEPSKSTVNDWFIAVCTLLEPLYEILKQQLLTSTYIQGDESPMKVLDKNKRGTSHQGYQWVYHSPSAGLVLFHYHRNRSAQAPKELLSTYKGVVQCDGYSSYNKLERIMADISLIGCWVHARRKFYEALNNDKVRSEHALGIFKEVYRHEVKCKAHTPEDRKDYRKQYVKPLMESLQEWIQEESIKVAPKSAIGKAMSYTQNQWPKLIRCLDDGRFELDNNLIENKIRPLALGRKNYLFAGSHKAAQRIAMMYSFFATCKIHGINPQEWLTDTLSKISDTKISNLESLLPIKPKV